MVVCIHTFLCQALLWEINAIWEDFNMVSNDFQSLSCSRSSWIQIFRKNDKGGIWCVFFPMDCHDTSLRFHWTNWKAQERVTVSTSQTSPWEAWFSTVFFKDGDIRLNSHALWNLCIFPYTATFYSLPQNHKLMIENRGFFIKHLCYLRWDVFLTWDGLENASVGQQFRKCQIRNVRVIFDPQNKRKTVCIVHKWNEAYFRILDFPLSRFFIFIVTSTRCCSLRKY